MKKFFAILILAVLAVSLTAPLAALAQKEKLKECCTIRQDISWKTGTICMPADPKTPDCTDAAPAELETCDNTATNPCKLVTNETIGPKGATCLKPADDPDKPSVVDYYTDQWGMICLVNSVIYVTNWIFYLMMIAVVIVFVIAAAMFMMAGGDVEKTKGAKGMMILGIVGLVIALIAKLVPSVVKLIVGM